MALIENIERIYTYRDGIADIIRLKGIDVPQNTKLRTLPQYVNMLVKPNQKEIHRVWEEEFQERCVADSMANYIEERARWDGHVDRAGLREIGWTEDDIDYFQANGVDWMAEDDDEYLVPDYEKELYRTNAIRTVDTKVSGVTIKATYTNTLISNNDPFVVELRNNVRWMPKFQNTALPQVISFRNFSKLIGCPKFDFSATTNPSYLFSRCVELRCVPEISFKKTSTWNGSYMFYECAKLKTIPDTINWENCSTTTYTFADCFELLYIPEINIPMSTSTNNMYTNCQSILGISVITSDKLTNSQDMFAGCRKLLTAPLFNTSNCTTMANMFGNCQSIYNVPLYDSSKNRNFNNFFKNCSNLLTCPEFDFNGGVTTYNGMFMGCEKLVALPTTINFDSCTDVASMCYRCLSITEFPYKLNINSSATSAAQGIKGFTSCIYFCTSLKKIELGLYKTSNAGFIALSPYIEEINVDDFDGGTNLLAAQDLFRVTKIGGELRGMRVSFDLSKMRKLPKESLIYVFERLEDMTDSGTTPKLTVGLEGLRNLTLEEKAIVTNKGWILA